MKQVRFTEYLIKVKPLLFENVRIIIHSTCHGPMAKGEWEMKREDSMHKSNSLLFQRTYDNSRLPWDLNPTFTDHAIERVTVETPKKIGGPSTIRIYLGKQLPRLN